MSQIHDDGRFYAEVEIDGERITVATPYPLNEMTRELMEDIYRMGQQYVDQNLKPR